MSDTTIDEIIQIVHGDKCPYAEPCPVKNQAKRTLYELMLGVIETNKDYVYVKGDTAIETAENIAEVDKICDIREELRAEQRTKLTNLMGDL